jgi:gluconokinase
VSYGTSVPTIIPGLRSPSEKLGGLVYFARMLDKMRLAAAGKLPEGWHAARGTAMKGSFDARCCAFLHIDYAALEAETIKGGTDEELLQWAFVNGRKPSEDEIEIWNGFMTKRGWRDEGTQRLNERLAEIGLPREQSRRCSNLSIWTRGGSKQARRGRPEAS